MIIEILHYVQNDIGGVFRRKDLYEIAAPSATARNDGRRRGFFALLRMTAGAFRMTVGAFRMTGERWRQRFAMKIKKGVE